MRAVHGSRLLAREACGVFARELQRGVGNARLAEAVDVPTSGLKRHAVRFRGGVEL